MIFELPCCVVMMAPPRLPPQVCFLALVARHAGLDALWLACERELACDGGGGGGGAANPTAAPPLTAARARASWEPVRALAARRSRRRATAEMDDEQGEVWKAAHAALR